MKSKKNMIYYDQKVVPIFEQLSYKHLKNIIVQPYEIIIKYKGHELTFLFNYICCDGYKHLIFEQVSERKNNITIREQIIIENKRDCKKYMNNFINQYLISTYY